MTSRAMVEFRGRAGAGVVKETRHYKLVRVLDQINMYVMPDDKSVTPCLERDGFWESWITAWVLNNVDSNTVFIDVGANTGYYSFVAGSKGATVIAFEPNPKYYSMMCQSATRMHSKVIIVPAALSDNDNWVVLNVPSELHGSASLREIDPEWNTSEVIVKAMTLDQAALDVDSPLVIKIDAEGAEEMIWAGMQETLKCKPVIILEYTPGMYSDGFLSELEAYAPLAYINNDAEEQTVTKEQIIVQNDWLMLVLRPND